MQLLSLLFLPLALIGDGRTPILTYHDFVPVRDSKALWFDCTPSEFVSQLDWMQKHGAQFVSIDRFANAIEFGQALPARAVVLTFADNYVGFLKFAYPLLRQRKIPSTMFVHTGYVGSRQGRPKMSWSELRRLDKEGFVTIASQTVSHPADLRRLTASEVEKEFRVSKQTLEDELGHPVRYLAYPNGKFNRTISMLARTTGYRMAFTEITRPAQQSPDRWRVNRYVHTKWRLAWRDAFDE